MNPHPDIGDIPEKESVNIRPTVTAGLANDVEEVKTYPAPIQAGTANGISDSRTLSTRRRMMAINPDVAMISPKKSRL